MRKLILSMLTAALVAAVGPATANASDWVWTPERAASALERYEPLVATGGDGAFCSGTGSAWRSNGKRMYERFRCDVYDYSGDYLGRGTLRVLGKSLRRYTFRYTTRRSSGDAYMDGYNEGYNSAPTTHNFGSGSGTVGLCRDGTLSDSIGRQGACSHHGGVS